MGCSIHMIVEIRQDGEWKYIPEVPNSLDQRNYGTFAFLADVRNSFDTKGFAPRGLPKDISGMKFNFESYRPNHLRRYKESDTYLLTPDGKYHGLYSEEVKKTTVEASEELYEKVNESPDERYRGAYWSETKGVRTHFVKDAEVVGGKWVTVPNKEVYPTFEEFEKDVWSDDEWDETMQDYGRWDVDFACEDYHTPSWLSLQDFLNADYTDFTAHKYKMDRSFYEKFKENGGVFPACFTVEEKSCVGTFIDAVRESFSPTVLVAWQMSDEEQSRLDLFKGITELEEIAKEYEVEDPEDIRIVFAFDN